VLASPWQELSHANPIFYMVNAMRYGFLGSSDVSAVLCFGITAAFALAMLAWAQWLFTTGHKLKP
jgi:ABC-2 type transport system permease protein